MNREHYDAITRLNCGVLEEKLLIDSAFVEELRKLRRPNADDQRVAQLLGAASLLLEEAARCCRQPEGDYR